ncbi:MAG: heme-binding domain-containing protein [Vicinamibacterales bacterium]
MSRTVRRLLIALAVLLAIQLVPVNRDNPEDRRGPAATPQVEAILRRACYDCHSNETVWPWYSRVAPVSWMVAYDVHEAREHLNFSDFQDLSEGTQVKVWAAVMKEIDEGEMPLWYYRPFHAAARLTEADIAILRAWK